MSDTFKLLGLSKGDLKIYVVLLRLRDSAEHGFSATEIAAITGRSRSAVECSLLKLVGLGLVERKVALSRTGGYVYIYRPRPLREAKKRLLKMLEGKCRKMRETIEGLSEDALQQLLVQA